MTYKLNPDVSKICAPVIVRFASGEAEQRFPNGVALADAVFEKNYLTDSLTVENESVVLVLRENDRVNVINWNGEEAVSFFA